MPILDSDGGGPAGSNGAPAPSLVGLMFMYIYGGLNPMDAVVLSYQTFAGYLAAIYGNGPVE